MATLVSCSMIAHWLEPINVFLRFFLLLNSITSTVTTCNVGVFKKIWANTWISFLHHRNQSSFLLSLEFEFMLLLAILNGLKSFRWYFLMFENNRIYWEVELLQHVNMKCNKTFYWYVKVFIWLSTGKSLYYISTQPFSSTYKHYYKIISQGNGKLVAYTPCLKCHDHSKLTGLRRMYVGIGPLVCINNLLITPVGNVLMRLGYQGKGTEDFSRQWLFFKPGNYHCESHTCAR